MKKLRFRLLLIAALAGMMVAFTYSTCKYGFKDAAPIPPEIKTFRVNYLENKAQYINTQLSPLLTEKLKQKIINTTRLRGTNSDDAHYDISGYVTQYFTSTTAISNNQSAQNSLTVGFHLVFKNSLDESKNFEADLSRTEPFVSTKSLSDVEAELTPKLVSSMVDEIFNKIFSNW